MDINESDVDALSAVLKCTKVSPSGVSFAGKSLKLNSESDAKPVIEQINQCSFLEFLNLEGNTLGVDAAKSIAESLEKRPEFKRALWKDMFTGRMKTEIPKALEFLGAGLVKARARLTELDLSDNAFGPIGVEGLAALLKSPTCYALEELRLNNNGLGITGGKLLANALTECYEQSKKDSKPLALRVFIAGRNRLENEGAIALAKVFKRIKTLEEVAMPQNGIYHIGITALSEAFAQNKNLKILNLNDNTFGEKGAEAIAKALVTLQDLKEINFGDCLLKTKGALLIAKGLKDGHKNLEELILESNEIKKEGGVALAAAMINKEKLKSLMLDCNQFGDKGVEDIRGRLKEIGKLNTLGSLEDNESEGESEEESQGCETQSENDEEENSGGHVEIEEIVDDAEENMSTKITVQEFLSEPTAHNLLLLGDDREQLLLEETKKNNKIDVSNFITILMKVSSLSENPKVGILALKIAETLYREIFIWAQKNDSMSIVNNCLLVHLGLIKSEDRKFKPNWNLTGCLNSLKNVSTMSFVPKSSKDALKVFMERQRKDTDETGALSHLQKVFLQLICLKMGKLTKTGTIYL
ncbi:ran GTPase-activating protein 1 isoform X1 [Euwallacea fornicatus]|uniref:ran GTPase-activating protein 1 isoform X1 n=1 Tax=Euwallacea fornicatus TaxID=995702 RepID=UPI00338EAB3D